jgi:hypothetical protein
MSYIASLLSTDKLDRLLGIKHVDNREKSDKYLEITNAINLCAKLIVEAINNNSDKSDPNYMDNNKKLLEALFSNRRTSSSQDDSIVNLVPLIEGSR